MPCTAGPASSTRFPGPLGIPWVKRVAKLPGRSFQESMFFKR